MRKKPVLCFFILVLSGLCGYSQTKLIAHKSHGGTHETFRVAYENAFAELERSDFGMAPERTVMSAALDSLIFLSDTSAIMVTSEHCKKVGGRSSGKPTTRWNPGKDTVYNHFLFTKKYTTEYIKSYLQQYYHFQNPVDSIKFVDLEAAQDSMEYQVPVAAGVTGGGTNAGTDTGSWLLLMILFSLAAALLLQLARRTWHVTDRLSPLKQ